MKFEENASTCELNKKYRMPGLTFPPLSFRQFQHGLARFVVAYSGPKTPVESSLANLFGFLCKSRTLSHRNFICEIKGSIHGALCCFFFVVNVLRSEVVDDIFASMRASTDISLLVVK